MSGQRRGILFVIAAPSGTGKTTVAREVMQAVDGLEFSVSYTTRDPRPGERDGVHYHFVSDERFDAMARDGAFLEWAEVYGHRYGTALDDTRRALGRGADLLLDIDVQGARQVRGRAADGVLEATSIMILPPDAEALRSRLDGRGTDEEPDRRIRLARARAELGEFAQFDYLVMNDALDRAVADVAAVIRAERRRARRCAFEAERILAGFSGS